MNEFERLRLRAELYKEAYPSGTRILLMSMRDDPRPIADNTRGTVEMVDDIGTLFCTFDNGRRLGVIPGEDAFRKLTNKELEEECGEKTSLAEKIQPAQKRASASISSEDRKIKSQEHEI